MIDKAINVDDEEQRVVYLQIRRRSAIPRNRKGCLHDQEARQPLYLKCTCSSTIAMIIMKMAGFVHFVSRYIGALG